MMTRTTSLSPVHEGNSMMLSHVSIGVRSIPTSKRFYDAVFGALGYRCLAEDASYLGYGTSEPAFWVLQGEQPVAAHPGSGLHFCFDAPNTASVRHFHAAGLKSGGSDNGAPGVRADYSADYYAAFLNDPDGYRLEAYCRGKE
jgi:catechol 2,3-dioxygenase-like lactoylglutathione lyase family enzyme